MTVLSTPTDVDATVPVAPPSVAGATPVRRRLGAKIWAGLVIVGAFAALALLAPIVARHDPLRQDVLNRLARPSLSHPVGTDALGRDAFARIVYAVRVDLPIGLCAALLPAVIGTLIGAVAGYFGGLIGSVVMRVADLVQAFPVYVFIIALVFALGPGARSILIAFAALAWVTYARLVRAEVLRIRELDYVAAARAGGLPHRRILFRHILPNAVRQVIVYFPADVLIAIVALASFSFLGLGIQPPSAEWGVIISDARAQVRVEWWLVAAPGLAIVLLGSGLMLIADGLDDRLRSR
jgi:peptide/nickel transport system permease protein